MGLMFDFGAVGHGWATTTSGFCLPCVMGERFARRVLWVRFARHG